MRCSLRVHGHRLCQPLDLSQLSLQMWSIWPLTNCFHFARSCAAASIVNPIWRRPPSSLARLLLVFFVLPLFLCPWGFHRRALLAMLSLGFLNASYPCGSLCSFNNNNKETSIAPWAFFTAHVHKRPYFYFRSKIWRHRRFRQWYVISNRSLVSADPDFL